MEFKVFDKYDMGEVEVKDISLKPYLGLDGKLLVKSHGRNFGKFDKYKFHILGRLATRIAVPGHIGKKHKIITSHASGNYTKNMKIVFDALDLIEKKKNENPIQVFIRAIENCAPRDEITTIEYGGARYPQAVDVSPARRINLALRWIVQGAYQKSFGKNKKMFQSLAEQIMLAADSNMEGYAMQKKNESEKQADAAR
jgi:small subunit ribosomal protein S7